MKHPILLSLLLVISLGGYAQLDLLFALGYGCGPQERLGSDYVRTDNMEMEQPLYGSLGSGVNVSVGAQKNLCGQGGVGVQADYVMGFCQTVDREEISGGPFSSTFESEDRNTSIQINPYAFIEVPLGDNWTAYGNIGPVINVWGQNQWHEEQTYESGIFNETYVWEETTQQRLALGGRAGIGLDYHLNDNLSLNVQAFKQTLEVRTKSTEVTLYTINGDDELSDLEVYNREINYVKKLDDSSNNAGFNDDYDVNQTQERLLETHTLSRNAITLGIRATF